MSKKQLAQAVGNVVNGEARKLSPVESATEQIRSLVDGGQNAKERGALAAQAAIDRITAATGFAVGLYCYIASIKAKEEAEDFVTGFVRKCEAVEASGEASPMSKQSAASAAQFESRMNRVIRAVHGYGKGSKAVEGWGSKVVLDIFNGDGTVTEKLQRLPSTRDNTPPKHSDVVEAVQKRYTASGDATPTMPRLLDHLSIPETVKHKGHEVKLTEADRAKLAMSKVAHEIKLVPPSHLSMIVEAVIDRLRQSPEKEWRELSEKFHEVWVQSAQGDASMGRKAAEAKADAKKLQEAGALTSPTK